MQPQQGSRIDLGELKAQIVKKVGAEKSKRYFYYLSRFVSQKLSKNEFDKSCYRLLGRENLPLHNQLILSILKNVSQAKGPPAKSVIESSRSSPIREDGIEQNGSLVSNQNQSTHTWSNGIFPVSPRKIRSGVRDRKIRDRPSPLGPNGKVEFLSHQPMGREDIVGKANMENGVFTPCDYQRPVQHLQTVAEQPEIRRRGLALQPTGKPGIAQCKGKIKTAVIEDGEEVEQVSQLNLSTTPLIAPLGIPFCPASVGGARKAAPVTNRGDFISCYDRGGLPGLERLRKHMEEIAVAQGLGGVSMECANMLNNILDLFLKNLIKSCVGMVGTRSDYGSPRRYPVNKQLIQNKVMNGMWPATNIHLQGNSVPVDVIPERRPTEHSISMLDFRVAMELNPQQLGEDWPSLLERICMHSFDE